MLIAHLADLHLGYRAYNKVSGGINVRERDVVLAFREAIDKVVALRPDLVLVAGDVFHSPRPSNVVMNEAYRGFSQLAISLPGAKIMVVSGNHDQPKSTETGSPLAILSHIPNVTVIDGPGNDVSTEAGGIPVLGWYWNEPSRQGTIGSCIGVWHGDPPPFVSGTYIALGHYHICEEVRPGMWYSGSIERTSSNIWVEQSPKGFLTYDTETKESKFHELKTRPMIDLPRIHHANERYLSEVRDLMEFLVETAEPDGKLIRLVIEDCPSAMVKEFDHTLIRDWKGRAVHFHLQPLRPAVRTSKAVERKASLEDELKDFVLNRFTPSSPDVDKNRVLELTQHYLALVAEEIPTE